MAQVFADCGHVRMINHAPGRERQHRVNESDQSTCGIESSDGRSLAGFRDHIETNGHYIDVVVLPDFPLKLYALVEVFYGNALSYGDIGIGHSG
jgi:hypothetical protein